MLRADFLLNGHGIHGKINALMEVFSCPFVDSVAKISVFISYKNKKPRSVAGLDETGWR